MVEVERTRYLASAWGWREAPETGLPEVAVCGRSNSGKSSLVNLLLRRRHIARISSTPGRTQRLNFFLFDDRFVLVDLPGYGYAKAPKAEAARWHAQVRAYLTQRDALKAVLLLLDIRRDPSPEDLAFRALVRASARKLLPVVTKSDKVPWGRRSGRLHAICQALDVDAADLIVTSVRKGEGRDELLRSIVGALRNEETHG